MLFCFETKERQRWLESKLEAKYRTVLTLWNLGVGLARSLGQFYEFSLGPIKPLTYIAAWPSVRLESGFQKAQQQYTKPSTYVGRPNNGTSGNFVSAVHHHQATFTLHSRTASPSRRTVLVSRYTVELLTTQAPGLASSQQTCVMKTHKSRELYRNMFISNLWAR